MKFEAEQVLHHVAAETGLEIVILRPPFVCGPKVKVNFAQMFRMLRRRIPLPLASVRNLRSLVNVGNLVDALITCSSPPAAATQSYLVSDGEDVSTPDLLLKLSEVMGCRARLLLCRMEFPCFAGRLICRSEQVERLIGSLLIDSTKIRREPNWVSPYVLQQGLLATVNK